MRKPEVRPAGIDAGVRGRHGRAGARAAVGVTRAYVGLGANLGDREAPIRRAAELLGAERLSTIRETEPWGHRDQPRFLNAVAELDTGLSAARAARPAARGRARARPHARRARAGGRARSTSTCCSTATRRIDEPGLTVPHPRLARAAVRARAARRARPRRWPFPGCGAVSDPPGEATISRREPPRRAGRLRGRARAPPQEGVQRGLLALPLLRADAGRDVPLQQARPAVRPAAGVPVLPGEDGGRLGLGQEPADPDDPARRGLHARPT